MTLIDYKNVEIQKDENIILKDVTFSLDKGDFLYIIGKVGSGKSSLLKTVYGEILIKKGTASVFDYNLLAVKRKQIPFLRRKVGIVFQDFRLLTDRSVHENLLFVLKATGWKEKIDMKLRMEEVLEQVGMKDCDHKFPHELSGGEQQRIVIARALLNSPELILADEPTGNLDPETGGQIVQLLHDISKTGTAVIMTTHNYHWVRNLPGIVMKCENQRLMSEKI
jgi:cell division transport system ATP-binding protein